MPSFASAWRSSVRCPHRPPRCSPCSISFVALPTKSTSAKSYNWFPTKTPSPLNSCVSPIRRSTAAPGPRNPSSPPFLLSASSASKTSCSATVSAISSLETNGLSPPQSSGCALVCREFAEQIDYYDPDRAYLAGLLHDLGIIVNSLAYTDEYRQVLADAVQSGRPLHEQERESLGFTHCDSGVILGKTWQLPEVVCEVIEWHHDVERVPSGSPLVFLVHLGDLLCRLRGLGYGYEEWRAIDLAADPAWAELARHCPKLATIDLARFTLDLDADVVRITKLVDTIFTLH